jgi:hypothetical protein
MSELTLIRLISIALTIAVYLSLPGNKVWTNLVFALGFSHYFVALIYSKKQVLTLANRMQNYLPLVIPFGIHHVLNEVYLLQRSWKRQFSAVLFNASIYLALVRSYPKLAFIPEPFLWFAVSLTGILFFYFLIQSVRTKGSTNIMDSCSLEILGLIILGCSFFFEITFLQIVCYHFVFWILFPGGKFLKQNHGKFVRYLIITLFVNAFFLMISPIGLDRLHLSAREFDIQFRFWSYFHITLSFAVSEAHPRWIRQWFRTNREPLPA